ncbi:MAG: T9SS type A sorting domain-containing protein, partial [Tannerella sp.]|nr:T9SS type A sorting domain-containing protein [Tannerella sp.]
FPTSIAHGIDIRTTASGLSEVTFYDAADNGKTNYKYELMNWPEEAKQAVMEAMVITENTLQIKHTMHVAFIWTPDLDNKRYLAVTHSSYVNIKGFSGFGVDLYEDYKYPAELIHQLVGNPVYDDINIVIAFNSVKNWCYSSSKKPAVYQQDLITVTLHELSHGFGINSSFNKNDEKMPYIFDKYICNERGEQITDDLYAATKANIASELTDTDLYYCGALGKKSNGDQPIRLHMPSTLSSASICHFDMIYENDERGRLLITGTTYGVSTRFFGNFALGIFQDLGWKLHKKTRSDFFSGLKSITTANEDIEQNNISISTGKGSIQIDLNTFDQQQIAIYTVSGHLVRNEVISGFASYNVPSNQIYIIRIGNKTKKVMVN